MTETAPGPTIMDGPREGCPAWCTDHEAAVNHHYRAVHAGDVRVSLRQLADPHDRPTLFVDNVAIDDIDHVIGQCDARGLARLLRKLGREDIAAAVEELAALAGGIPPTG